MSPNVRGWHVALLVFAVLLLSVPASRWMVRHFEIPQPFAEEAVRLLPLAIGTLLFIGVRPLRRHVANLLRPSIPMERRRETSVVTALAMLFGFAATGGIFAWAFVTTGPEGVERLMSRFASPEEQWAEATSPFGIFWCIGIAGLIGPLIEEIVFRGLLQGAWERRWGWLPAATMTSAVFGLYHPHFFVAFTSAIVFSCLYRRTNSLWAPIACHMVGNLSLWYPLLGRFVFPLPESAQGDPATWWLQLTSLVFATVLIPTYVVLAARFPHEEQASTEVLGQPA